MEKAKMVKYIELYNRYDEALAKKERVKFSESEAQLITDGNMERASNPQLQEIYMLPLSERKKYVEEYEQEQVKLAGEDEEMKAIKEAFGFDITNIENKKLENGVEIFKFYAPRLQRVVVLENRKDKSLTEQLKEMQAINEKYQTSNDVQNTNDMLEEERQKNDVELKMIYPSEIDNYKNTMDEMKPEDLKKLNYIIANADNLGVKKINIQNLIYLDQNDNIREVVYDKEKDQIEDQDPNTLQQNVEQVNTSDKIDTSLSTEGQISALSNSYEDTPTEVSNVEVYEELPIEIQNQVVTYHDYPELLNSIEDEEERKRWEHYIELYNEHEKKKYIAPEMPKQKILTPSGKGNGAVDIILLTLITVVALAAICLVAYQFLK